MEDPRMMPIQSDEPFVERVRQYYSSKEIHPGSTGFNILNQPDNQLTWLIALLHNQPIPFPDSDPSYELLIPSLINHKIAGYIAYLLNRYPRDYHLSHHGMETISRILSQQAVSWLRTLTQIAKITQFFNDAGIEFVLLKGPALAMQVYPHPSLRDGIDIDLAIHPEDVKKASEILLTNGYHIRFDSNRASEHIFHHQVFFPDQKTGVKTVELHWRPLGLPEVTGEITAGDLLERRVFLHSDIGLIPVLSITDILMYVSMHMCISHADELRLIWILDIHLLSEYITKHDLWNEVREKAVQWNGVESLHRSLIQASLWMGSPEPDAIPELPEASREEKGLFAHLDRRRSGEELNLHEQLRRMPGTIEKVKAFIYCFTATTEIQTGQRDQPAGIKIRAWWERWKKINAPHNPTNKMLLFSWCSWCGSNVKMLIRKR